MAPPASSSSSTSTPSIPVSPVSNVPLLFASLKTGLADCQRSRRGRGDPTPKSRDRLVFMSASPSSVGSVPSTRMIGPLRMTPPLPRVPLVTRCCRC